MQVKGEGLNVGCVLTWGPCFEFQRQFFSPIVDEISGPMTLLKYDLEISGFGSAALGHVCLLNLKDQTYPGSDGTKEKGWPTWTTPVMRWTKEQGGIAGYAHSGSGLHINAESATKRLFRQLDVNEDQVLEVPADGQIHVLKFRVEVEKSSWIALRHFPQLHTNPVNVIVSEKPIRASRKSALWCIETIEQLWRVRENKIADQEKPEARVAFDRAIRVYERIAREAGS